MGKDSKHRLLKDKSKNRVNDLQGMFNDLQNARMESRLVDVSVLEKRVQHMLREWNSELNQPSPASSLQQGGSLASFSSDFISQLQDLEEKDDATSTFAELNPKPDGKKAADGYASQEGLNIFKGPQKNSFELDDLCKDAENGFNMGLNTMNLEQHLDFQSFDFQDIEQCLSGFDCTNDIGQDGLLGNSGYQHMQDGCPQQPSAWNCLGQEMPQNSDYQQGIYEPPPSAYLGPKCALWDCPRLAERVEWSLKSDNYCDIRHSTLALIEGKLGRPPVVRPGGIRVNDNLLFATLTSKAQGVEVGIPECVGAATAKSPWNATELFDLAILEGETTREWLFFDKPRRAFESGSRKQRSLPDHKGRGWHESRKISKDEYGGLNKRSYYMDPQPNENFKWYLHEYEAKNDDTFALYRLEFKRAEKKEVGKGKSSKDPVANLQKEMGRLTAEVPTEKQSVVKRRGKANAKDAIGNRDMCSGSNTLANPGEGVGYGRSEL